MSIPGVGDTVPGRDEPTYRVTLNESGIDSVARPGPWQWLACTRTRRPYSWDRCDHEPITISFGWPLCTARDAHR